MLIFLLQAVKVDRVQAGVKTTLEPKRCWKPGIYANRICGEDEVAVSAMILVALSVDSLPSSVFFSKPNNLQYCHLQVVDFSKKKKVKYFSIHSFSLIKITSNTTKKIKGR